MIGLQYIRKAYGMSLDTLGKRMGITRQTISQWEHGTCAIPGSRLKEMSQIFGVPEHLLGEITEQNKIEIDTFLQAEKATSEESFLFSRHEAALKNERLALSRVDYHLKGKGREFSEFEDLISFIDGETGAMNRIMDIISDDTMRPVLYAILKAFEAANTANKRTELLTTIKNHIDHVLENSIEQEKVSEFFNSANETDLY